MLSPLLAEAIAAALLASSSALFLASASAAAFCCACKCASGFWQNATIDPTLLFPSRTLILNDSTQDEKMSVSQNNCTCGSMLAAKAQIPLYVFVQPLAARCQIWQVILRSSSPVQGQAYSTCRSVTILQDLLVPVKLVVARAGSVAGLAAAAIGPASAGPASGSAGEPPSPAAYASAGLAGPTVCQQVLCCRLRAPMETEMTGHWGCSDDIWPFFKPCNVGGPTFIACMYNWQSRAKAGSDSPYP